MVREEAGKFQMRMIFQCSGWRLACVAAIALVGASGVSASTSSCGTKSALSSFGSTPSTTSGCYEIDKSFTNLGVTNTGSTTNGAGVDQSSSIVDIQGASPTQTSGNTVAAGNTWSISTTFTPTAADEWEGTDTGGATVGGIIGGNGVTLSDTFSGTPSGEGMVVNSTGVFIHYGTGTGQNPNNVVGGTGDHTAITSVSLEGVTGNAGTGTGSEILVYEIFCVGTATCTSTDEVTLEGTISEGSTAVTYTCTPGTDAAGTCSTVTGTSATFTFTTLNTMTVNLVDSYELVLHGDDVVTLSSFENVFGEEEVTPEPGTLLLVGGALAGVGLLRFRKRRA